MGVDPGIENVGIGIVDMPRCSMYMPVYSQHIKTRRLDPLPKRLDTIGHTVSRVIDEYQPDQAVIEDFFYHRHKAAMKDICKAIGVIEYVCMNHGIQPYSMNPINMKQIISSNSRAEKTDIELAVRGILGLDEGMIRVDHVADAYGLAIAYGTLACELSDSHS